MDLFADIYRSLFWFLVLLTPLVFVHELGHFLVARLCGVRVEVFSIGFGPELFGFTDHRGTRWKFSLFPLGGYVRMFGESAEATTPAEDASHSFAHKSVARRAAIVAAGPAANFLFALLVLTTLYAAYGKAYRAPVIDAIAPGSAAAAAGLAKGDRILAIDGREIDRFEDIAAIVQLNLDHPLRLLVERSGERIVVDARPTIVAEKDLLGREMRVGRLGIASDTPGQVMRLNLLQAAGEAGRSIMDISDAILTSLWQILSGNRSSDEVGGVLRIAAISGAVAQSGWADFIGFAALLSVNLGLFNLFPVPLLDGGHLAFYAAEALRGRPLGARAQEWGLKIGLAMMLGLMIFATWNDLVYLRVVDYLRSLLS